MKKLLFISSTIFFSIFMLSACVSSFNAVELNNKFNEKNTAKKKPSKVEIYWSEKDVTKPYTVTYQNRWEPLVFFPFINYNKQIRNGWVNTAVHTCEKLKGNAVIMGDPGCFAIIKY